MAIRYLKQATKTAQTSSSETHERVLTMLTEIETRARQLMMQSTRLPKVSKMTFATPTIAYAILLLHSAMPCKNLRCFCAMGF